MRGETVAGLVGDACPIGSYPEQWDVAGLKERTLAVFGFDPPVEEWLKEESVEPELLASRIQAQADAEIATKTAEVGDETWRSIEKSILLQSLDEHWKEHLATLDALRQVIHLRAYAQKTPINEYKQEAFALFERMLAAIRENVTHLLAISRFMSPQPLPEMPDFITSHIDPLTGFDDSADTDMLGASDMGLVTTRLAPLSIPQPDFANAQPNVTAEELASWGAVSRNAPCPCGSGRKFKHCHGVAG